MIIAEIAVFFTALSLIQMEDMAWFSLTTQIKTVNFLTNIYLLQKMFEKYGKNLLLGAGVLTASTLALYPSKIENSEIPEQVSSITDISDQTKKEVQVLVAMEEESEVISDLIGIELKKITSGLREYGIKIIFESNDPEEPFFRVSVGEHIYTVSLTLKQSSALNSMNGDKFSYTARIEKFEKNERGDWVPTKRNLSNVGAWSNIELVKAIATEVNR